MYKLGSLWAFDNSLIWPYQTFDVDKNPLLPRWGVKTAPLQKCCKSWHLQFKAKGDLDAIWQASCVCASGIQAI